MGFKTIAYKLDTDIYNQPLSFSLTEENIVLDEVIVKAKQNNENWKYDYALFKREFIGTSKFSRFCKIQNPKALRLIFNTHENKLTAYADKPLHIINEALGYEIFYKLEHFTIAHNITTYLGYAHFKEMKGGKRKQKQWQKNRLEAYNGSFLHFFKSVLRNTTRQEGFIINQFKRQKNPNRPTKQEIAKARDIIAKADTIIAFSKKIKTPQNALDSAIILLNKLRLPKYVDYLYKSDISSTDIVTSKDSQTFLSFENNLSIVYTKEKEEESYILRKAFSKPREALPQTSNIIPLQLPMLITKNGTLQAPLSVHYEGYWSYEKFANAVPLDYKPTK